VAITVNWATKVIFVPKADMPLISGTKYSLDIDVFRLALKSLEASEEGMPFVDTHKHVTEITVAGVTYARFIEIINGYTVEFEDGQYTVIASGANHNVADVVVENQVSLVTQNSAGLTTPLTVTDVASAVWSELMAGYSGITGSAGAAQLVPLSAAAISEEVHKRSRYTKRDNINYDGNGFLINARERWFPTKADAVAGTNATDTFTVTATPDGVEILSPATFDKIRDT